MGFVLNRMLAPGRLGASNATVSVIVPVFNVEEWLPALIMSLREQTFEDWEAIFVLDGSTDASADIAQDAASSDERIVIIDVENGGAGRARNLGMEHSRGRYIAFFDADDLVPPNALELLVNTLMETGSDVATGMAMQTKGGTSGTWPYWTMRGGAHSKPALGVPLTDRPELIFDHTVWNKLYRADFLRSKQIRFPEGTTCEDMMFCARVLVDAQSIDILSETVYIHRRRPGSVTTSGHFSESALRDWMRESVASAELVYSLKHPELSSVYSQRMLRNEAWTRAAQWADMDDDLLAAELAGACGQLFAMAPELVTRGLPASIRATYTMMLAGARELAPLVGGSSRPATLTPANLEKLRQLVGDVEVRVLATALAKHNLVDPVFNLDLPVPDDAALRDAKVFLEALPELDRVALLERREESAAVIDAIHSLDRAAISRIRFGAAKPYHVSRFKWLPARREFELQLEGSSDSDDIGATWISTEGKSISVSTVRRNGRVCVSLPDESLMSPGEEFSLVLQRPAPAGVLSALRFRGEPRSRRFDRIYAHRTREGLILVRNRGRFYRRVATGVRVRIRRLLPSR